MEPHSQSIAATVAHIVITALLTLSVAFAAYMVVQAIRGSDAIVSVRATAALDDDLLPKGVYATSEQRTGIAIRDATDRERRLEIAGQLVALLLWIGLLWLLRGITRSLNEGDPFVTANVRRLQAIGGLLILGVVAAYYAQGALEDELLSAYSTSSSPPFDEPGLLPPHRDFPETPLLCGLGVLVLAQVFAHGTRLREDVDATI